MSTLRKPLLIVLLAVALFGGFAGAAQADTIYIGNFSWITAPDGSRTLEVDTLGSDPWPIGLSLDNVYADFITPGGSGQAYFDGDLGTCAGNTISLNAAGLFYQSPGDFSGGCSPLGPLPQDILSATLVFSYDDSLGTVTVNPLGPAFNREFDETAQATTQQQILFQPAITAVPEPASLVLFGTGLTVLGRYQRRRQKSKQAAKDVASYQYRQS